MWGVVRFLYIQENAEVLLKSYLAFSERRKKRKIFGGEGGGAVVSWSPPKRKTDT